MHKKFVEFLCDPISQEPLELIVRSARGDLVDEGSLESSTGSYPIVRGIPRFAGYEGENYAENFGYQWHKWSKVQFEDENVGMPMEGHTTSMWESVVGRDVDVSDQVVLDIGCGPGRFVDVARRKDAIVIGVDYSNAVEVAANIFADDPNVCICQGDALALPIKDGAVDLAFSIGVLHHTPDPEEGVRNAYRVVRPEGQFALAVYASGGYYDAPVISMWRKLFRLTWPALKQYPPLIYSYFTVYVLRIICLIPVIGTFLKAMFPFFDLPDRRWSLLDTFDSVTPAHQTGHSTYEVFCWFRSSGFKEIEPTEWGSTRGRKTVTLNI